MTRAAFVMVTTSYPMTTGGREAAGSFVSDLAEELARTMPVRVVAPGSRSIIEGSETLRVFRYRAPEKPLSTLKPWRAGDLAGMWSVMAGGQQATNAAVTAGPVAMLLALWALPSGHWARRSARLHGLRYSVWTLGSDIWSLGKIPLVRTRLSSVLSQAEFCYSDGLQLADDTRRISGRDVTFLPSTRRISSSREQPVRSRPPYRLLFLGRWHPNKGVDLLLQALGMLGDEDWERIASVSICGGGAMEEEVSRGVTRLRHAGHPVEQRGYLGKPEAEAAIASADFLLIPSRIESIPVVFSDAMKLDCPVVVSPVGDLPRLVAEAECGLVAESATAESFSGAIRKAVRASPMEFVKGANRMRDQFDIGAVARQLTARTEGR